MMGEKSGFDVAQTGNVAENRAPSPIGRLLYGINDTTSEGGQHGVSLCWATKNNASETRIKWRSSAWLSGESISMGLTDVAMPRSSLYAASGHAAQNNSYWEIAA